MPNYKIVHRAPAVNQKREVRISATATATPAGFTQLVASVALDQSNRKALYHLVRDELYKIGVTNLQDLIIVYEGAVPAPDYHIWEKELHLRVGDIYPLNIRELPTNLGAVTATAVSSLTGIATVAVSDQTVNVTAVAPGQSVISVTILGEVYKLVAYVTEAWPVVEDEEEEP